MCPKKNKLHVHCQAYRTVAKNYICNIKYESLVDYPYNTLEIHVPPKTSDFRDSFTHVPMYCTNVGYSVTVINKENNLLSGTH